MSLATVFPTRPAGEIGRFRGGNGFPVRYQGTKNGSLPFFKVSDMNNPGNEVFMTQARHYISEHQRKQIGAIRFPAGAIVFAKVGAAVFLERKRILAQESCIDNNMAALVVDRDVLDIRYVHYQLCSFKMSSLVATTALPSLNGSQLRSVPIRLAPTLEEQRRIAETLADADGHVATLKRLIDKKETIKQGMMQQLLTAKTRLPGFSGAWLQSTVADMAHIVSGGTPKSSVAAYWDGDVAWCTPTDITSEPSRYLRKTARTISPAGLTNSAACLLPKGSLLLCTRATIGAVKIALGSVATNQGFKSLVPKPNMSSEFVYYKLLIGLPRFSWTRVDLMQFR